MQREEADSRGELEGPIGPDMEIAAVNDDGRVLIRFFGGSAVEVAIPAHLVPYYRRLLRRSEIPPEARL